MREGDEYEREANTREREIEEDMRQRNKYQRGGRRAAGETLKVKKRRDK